MEEKLQGMRSASGRYKIDRRRLRIVWEMEKPKNLCVSHGHELRWGNNVRRDGTRKRGIKGRKKWDNCNSIINYIYIKN